MEEGRRERETEREREGERERWREDRGENKRGSISWNDRKQTL